MGSPRGRPLLFFRKPGVAAPNFCFFVVFGVLDALLFQVASGDLTQGRRILDELVLTRSLHVALDKWAAKHDRFFLARDENGYRIVRDQAPDAYLTDDRPRIAAAYSLMADLGLVTWGSPLNCRIVDGLFWQRPSHFTKGISYRYYRTINASCVDTLSA